MLFGLVVSPYPTLERQEQTGTVLLRLRQSTPRRCCVHTEVSLQWFTVSDCNDLDEVCAQADCVVAGGFLRAVSSAQRCQQCRLQLLSRASASSDEVWSERGLPRAQREQVSSLGLRPGSV